MYGKCEDVIFCSAQKKQVKKDEDVFHSTGGNVILPQKETSAWEHYLLFE